MKKKALYIVTAAMILSSTPIAYPVQPVFAAAPADFDNAVERKIESWEISSKDRAWKVIQDALYEARDFATENQPYVIVVEPGEYYLNGLLRIYSNTKLVLDGVTLHGDDGKNVLRIGELDEKATGVTGYYYNNIEVVGGVLEGGGHANTVFKIAHAANVKVTGTTLQNTKNAHLMEVAGVDGLVIENCHFKNQVLDVEHSARSYEALQLDVLEYSHMGDCRSEDLPIKNVRIDGCTFTNVPRGIGSHTAILNQPLTGIQITNCKFEKMSSAAIQAQGWVDCTISGNTITDSPRGIAYYSVMNAGEGTFLSSVLAKEGGLTSKVSEAYQVPADDQKIVISNNKITLNEKQDPYADYERTAILVSGKKVEKKTAYKDGSGNIPVGNYYPSGVVIKENEIKTTGQGIRFFDVKNAQVIGNKVEFAGASDAGKNNYYGIQITEQSEKVSIEKNIVRNSDNNAIYVAQGSVADSIDDNTIYNSGKYGIDVEASIAGQIHGNSILLTANRGIFIYNQSRVSSIQYNTTNKTTNYAIQISGSSVDKVMNNTITNPGNYGIMYCEKSVGKEMSGNKITGAVKNAVSVTADSSVDKVSDN